LVVLRTDESSNLKKGDYSVGVTRQYCSTIGKVDNCHVAVYAGVSAENYYGLTDNLPESRTSYPKRCKVTGVPKERYKHKTKFELVIDIVKYQIEIGTSFDFVGADGLYGNNHQVRKELDNMEVLFVPDIHRDHLAYSMTE